MKKYQAKIFNNGRIVLIPEEDFIAAADNCKEILVFCGGWSGGYARAFGANVEHDFYSEDPEAYCYNCYAYDVNDQTFTPGQLTKFYRIIVTDGIKVYMKTGEPATAYFGGMFSDWDTKYKDYLKNIWNMDKNVIEEEFEKLRHQIDVKKTFNMICGSKEEKEEIRNAIKGYLH